MIPGLNPKKMQAMMKQLGMSQEDIDASEVIIKKPDGKIIIDNPSVAKVTMQGQETFQISGDIREESDEKSEQNNETDEQEEQIKQDIETIMEKTGFKDKEQIAIELEKNNGDIAKTILDLKNN